MELSPEQISSFQNLYRNHFGIDLNVSEALEKAIALLSMMKAVYVPITKGDLENIRNQKN
ncbi:MAG: hypothetical protein AAB473_02250 [Patescibacteria group bacterium]